MNKQLKQFWQDFCQSHNLEYEYWRRAHDDFFDWEYREAGKVFYPQAPVVCEVFEKVE